ncbi:MAG: discoidin domain-containing protein, partial [Kiritimatiellaceae bacterium]|nr:discoidin domain-containing protein [Kiritimatiellaceae bacterium]
MSKEQLDDFSDLSVWTAIASGQACLTISPDHCPSGDAMRLDFDFHGGGGFVVARRSYTPTLPESYVFSFDLCGQGLSNIFEFKLVDSANQNVWRWRREVFDLTADWQTIQIKSSEMQFAWGPLGGGPACDIAAIELVIAAGPGGQGTVRVGNLRFEDTSYYLTPVVSATHALPGYEPQAVLDPSRSTGWRSASTKDPQQLTLDFQQEREYGGLTIVWDPERRPASVNLELSSDGVLWKSCFSTDQGVGRETHVYLPGASSRFVRMTLKASASGLGLGVVFIEVQPYAFSKSMNDFFSSIARCSEPGLYPKYLLGHQTYWTPVGTGEDVTQALFNEEGMVEVDQGSFSIEPFLYAEGHLISWADAVLKQTLERGDLPIPSSEWSVGRLLFKSTAFATGPEGSSSLFVRYCITNRSDQAMPVTLFAAIRPFQVTPTWQNWDRFGGVSPIHELAYERGSVRVDQGKRVIPLTAPSQFGAN